jgi:hypothetical protein
VMSLLHRGRKRWLLVRKLPISWEPRYRIEP